MAWSLRYDEDEFISYIVGPGEFFLSDHETSSESSEEAEDIGGWSFDFVDKVDPDYICPICLRPARDPVQTQCGHLFCQTCLDRNLLERSECPVDKQDISKEKIFSDVRGDRKIMTFKVRCTFSDVDCEWEGELRDLLKQHLDKCGKTLTRCEVASCAAYVKRKRYHDHVNNKCLWRRISCKYCESKVIFSKLLEHHSYQCLKFPVKCKLGCGFVTERENINNHESVCPCRIIPCIYAKFGCSEKVRAEDMDNHIEENIRCHMDKMALSFDKELESLKKEICQLKEENNVLKAPKRAPVWPSLSPLYGPP